MAYLFERRQNWHRIIGLERRGAPFSTLMGRPLPDPTRLLDEEFQVGGDPGQENGSRNAEPWRPGNKHP